MRSGFTSVDEPRSSAVPPAVRGDSDLWPAWIVLWLGSVARVAFGLVERETFGAEATLALFSAAVVPWIVLAPWIRRWWSDDRAT
jgi:hypothetical protein